MTAKEAMNQEIDNIPDTLLKEVLDFVRFLKAKHLRAKLGISVLTESSLQKDWLRPEEDEAWRDL